MEARKVMPTTYLLLAILIMLVLHWLIPLSKPIPSPWHLLGLGPLGAGLALNLLADRAFHRARTTVKPLEPPTTLLREGVFRLTRNPMYLGFVLILLGIALLLRAASPFLMVPAYGMLVDRLFITVEEANLERSFGDARAEYRACVRRWL